MSVTPVPREQPTIRVSLRVIVTVVLSALALVLMYLVREPLGWVVLAMFLAIAASGPEQSVRLVDNLGVIGALVAIPTAAAILIAIREFLDYRRAAASQARP